MTIENIPWDEPPRRTLEEELPQLLNDICASTADTSTIGEPIYSRSTGEKLGIFPGQVPETLANADLSRFALSFRKDWQGMNFEGADVRDVSFEGCNLRGANFTGAIMVSTNLKGVDLSETTLTGADLRGAVYDDDTQWPPDFDLSSVYLRKK